MASRNRKTSNQIAKAFKNIIKKIGNFFKKITEKIKALPSKIKAIIIVWLVILLIIILLIVMISSNKNKLETYHNYEKVVNDAAIKYVTNNSLHGAKESKLKVDLEVLKDEGLITENDLKDNTCLGYSLTYYDSETDTYSSNSYINCKGYTSEDYYEFK